MNTLKVSAAASALVLLAAGLASAQTDSAPKPRQACMADVQRLCPDATPGRGYVMRCLKGHMADVSEGCKSAVMAHRADMQARKAAAQSAAPANAPPPS